MKSSHKNDERTEPADHEQWIANLRWTFVVHAFKILGSIYILGALTSGFAVYQAFSAKVEINQATIETNKKQIEELKDELTRQTTYRILSEKKWSEIANLLEAQGKKEIADMIRDINNKIDKGDK